MQKNLCLGAPVWWHVSGFDESPRLSTGHFPLPSSSLLIFSRIMLRVCTYVGAGIVLGNALYRWRFSWSVSFWVYLQACVRVRALVVRYVSETRQRYVTSSLRTNGSRGDCCICCFVDGGVMRSLLLLIWKRKAFRLQRRARYLCYVARPSASAATDDRAPTSSKSKHPMATNQKSTYFAFYFLQPTKRCGRRGACQVSASRRWCWQSRKWRVGRPVGENHTPPTHTRFSLSGALPNMMHFAFLRCLGHLCEFGIIDHSDRLV